MELALPDPGPCRQYLINHARPFIYTTALPAHSIGAIDCAFHYLGKNMSSAEIPSPKD